MRGDDEPALEPFLLGAVGAQQLGDRFDRRLDGQDVEPGAGDMAALQQLVERVEVEDRAARVVDDDGAPRQQRELFVAEEPLGLDGQRAMDRERVGLAQQVFERRGALDAEPEPRARSGAGDRRRRRGN